MGIETAIIAGAGLVGGIGGSMISAKGAKDAASTAAGGADAASQVQMQMYNQSRQDQAPWRSAGEFGLNALLGAPSGPTTPKPTWEDAAEKYISGRREATPNAKPFQRGRTDEYMEGPWRTQINAEYQNMLNEWETTGDTTNRTGGLLTDGPGDFKASPSYEFVRDEGLRGAQRVMSSMGANRSGAHIKAATEYSENLASREYDNFLNRWYASMQPYQALAGVGGNTAANMGNQAMQQGQMLGNNAMAGGNALAAGQLGQANTWANALQWGGGQAMDYANYRQQPNALSGYGGGGYSGGGYGSPPASLNVPVLSGRYF